ncbi:unnamed protein product [Rhizoctonia solani]|uniref:Nephrocystin 3-like N-terminal domain-containing protein n=1 Tax=Rhizoctonia solani TaxID=456999 RepID=A0A8H2WFN0_9AGAM|nr:unnamed protein product [Rhizoctonia solani]
MDSPDPPGRSEKRKIRHTLRSGYNWVKGLARPSSTPPSSGPQQSLTVPSSGSRRLSLSRLTDSAPVSSNTAWHRLGSSLREFENRLGVFPPLKSAVGAVIGCLDVVQAAASSRGDYEKLADDFQSMADIMIPYISELESEPNNGSIANIVQSIEQQVKEIKEMEKSGSVRRLLNATQDQEDVVDRYRHIERLFRQLQCDLSMRTSRDVKEQLETTRLRGMFPVDDARYNSSYSTTIKRRACTAQTREKIHQDLQTWTTNPEGERIYWMNGMAGTGKTTIAYSLCEWLENTHRLGASFFCSRISSTCRSLSRIVPTLAYQLARYSPAFLSALCTALKDNPDAGTLNVVQQFEKLVYHPMLNVKNAIPESVVIVVDALDECDDAYSVRLLLDVLLRFADQLPVKFFVASRPEHVIRDRMMSRAGSARFIVYLHDIEQSIVEEDIKKYLTEALSPMEPSPSAEQIGLLAQRSRNLFIYAATLVRYIYPDGIPVDSSDRLESILQAIGTSHATSDNRYKDLDLLYTTVLNVVFNDHLGNEEKERMRRVLWTVVCAREPITAATIASLASLTERQVSSALQLLRSVVHVPEDSSLISTLHASFPEYMLDTSRSKGFCCDESRSNEMVVHRCFDVMKTELKFNICQLENSYLADNEVNDLEARVVRYISPTLSYACRYWSSHLRLSSAKDISSEMLLDFLYERFLFWMEVLSLSRCIGIGATMMQQAQTWLRQMNDNSDEIQKQVSDARNFVTWFAANSCSRSTPHIYISALPLCAKSSWMYEHYFQRTTGLASVSVGQNEEAILAVWSLELGVYSVAISPDGNRIASASGNGSVRIYDMHTGAVVAGPFQGHTRIVLSVAFSPDGRRIASGSVDQTVIVWDAQTGRIVTGPLHKHTGWVRSVAFSPDGRHLVSGSKDKTIIVWDTFTGAIALGPLEGYSAEIRSVAFSPDGQMIASGSEDQTIQLWNASTGAAFTEPLRGHTDRVNMVAFSPDGSKLASCASDKTIRVWDIKAGTTVGLPFTGHKGAVWSIAFSHDGRWIASGGANEDNDIIVWDTLTGSVILGPFSGHTHHVYSVAFTPDNTRIVSSSEDRTICIWDVQPQNKGPGQKGARDFSVGPVAFLRNRTQLISCTSTGILKVWDMHTGTTISREFEGQAETAMIYSITISPQDTLVAVGANNPAIRVWSICTGKLVCQLVTAHKSPIRCFDFSPDGTTQLCSGSDDATVAVWNIDTGTMVSRSYTGHTGAVTSVTFSPDTTRIASSSADCTIRIWDKSTGALIYKLDGHESSVSSVVFSPDGSLIVAGSTDGVIRQWDAKAGTLINHILPIHSDADSDSSSETDGISVIHCVCFSPDGTRIISGFGSSLHLVDTHTMKLIFKMKLSQGEMVRWVGYSPDGMNIISVSTTEGASASEPNNDSTRQSAQSSNIIRVWRATVRPDQMALSSTPQDWSYEKDGRVMSPEGFVMWIPPNLRWEMKAHTQRGSESHYSPLVMSSDEFINIGYRDLRIGNRWAECYVLEN